MRAKPSEAPDGCGSGSSRCYPRKPRRFRYPGRKPFDDRLALQGILFVLHTGICWEHLPQALGFGCGMTACRRLRAWQQAGVWERLHELLLAELHAAEQLEWERAIADSSHVEAKKGARKRVPAPSTGAARAVSTTCSSTMAASHLPGRSPVATASTSPT
jgi:transposase